MDGTRTKRKIAAVVTRLRDSEVQRRLAALQAEPALRAGEGARRCRRAPESAETASRGSLDFRHGVFWLKAHGAEAGPLCPECWGRDHDAVLMQVGAETWSCPTCHRMTPIPGLR